MKHWIYYLAILASLAPATVMAADLESSAREAQPDIELKSHAIPKRYTFQDYLSDVVESTRIDQVDPKNPIRQREAQKEKKYEPLNPLVLFRW